MAEVEEFIPDSPNFEDIEEEDLIPETPFIEEEREEDTSITTTTEPLSESDANYIKNQKAREKYEGSPGQAQDIENDLDDDIKVPFQ